ncbi:MAG: hypothetical protein EBZ77_16540, partial [Chitinophagia bacterium]|nr:hypothetical protein [Chitinophagia bacterium]
AEAHRAATQACREALEEAARAQEPASKLAKTSASSDPLRAARERQASRNFAMLRAEMEEKNRRKTLLLASPATSSGHAETAGSSAGPKKGRARNPFDGIFVGGDPATDSDVSIE